MAGEIKNKIEKFAKKLCRIIAVIKTSWHKSRTCIAGETVREIKKNVISKKKKMLSKLPKRRYSRKKNEQRFLYCGKLFTSKQLF